MELAVLFTILKMGPHHDFRDLRSISHTHIGFQHVLLHSVAFPVGELVVRTDVRFLEDV